MLTLKTFIDGPHVTVFKDCKQSLGDDFGSFAVFQYEMVRGEGGGGSCSLVFMHAFS